MESCRGNKTIGHVDVEIHCRAVAGYDNGRGYTLRELSEKFRTGEWTINRVRRAMGMPPLRFPGVFVLPFRAGDRVEVRDGYELAGDVGVITAKSAFQPDSWAVDFCDGTMGKGVPIIEAALIPKPYTREERIEHAIKAVEGASDLDCFRLAPKIRAKLADTLRSAS